MNCAWNFWFLCFLPLLALRASFLQSWHVHHQKRKGLVWFFKCEKVLKIYWVVNNRPDVWKESYEGEVILSKQPSKFTYWWKNWILIFYNFSFFDTWSWYSDVIDSIAPTWKFTWKYCAWYFFWEILLTLVFLQIEPPDILGPVKLKGKVLELLMLLKLCLIFKY